jgi:hypothetical protein
LPIYETTTDDAGIAVERAHLLITVQDESLSVGELQVFANPGDRTYIGKQELEGRRWTSRFALPEDASGLTFEDGSLGGRFLSTENGFVDTEPLWPGRTSVMFRYVIPCSKGDCRLVQEITYPVSSLNVLIPDTGVTIEGKGLQLQGQVPSEGQSYLNYVAGDLQAGQKLDLTVHLSGSGSNSGTVGGATTRNSSGLWPWLLLGLVITALALGYPFWRQRLVSAQGLQSPASEDVARPADERAPGRHGGSRRRRGSRPRMVE